MRSGISIGEIQTPRKDEASDGLTFFLMSAVTLVTAVA